MNKLFLPMMNVAVMTPGLRAGTASEAMNNETCTAGSLVMVTDQRDASCARQDRGAHNRSGRGGD